MHPILVKAPFVHSVFHPTDLSEASERAFAHALEVAVIRETRFTVLHVGPEYAGSLTQMPQVRRTLERWGLMGGDGPHPDAYRRLNMRVKKIHEKSGSALGRSIRYLKDNPTDLIVLATHGREGLPRWFRPSVAERAGRQRRGGPTR